MVSVDQNMTLYLTQRISNLAKNMSPQLANAQDAVLMN